MRFELTVHIAAYTRFPSVRLQPLGHSSMPIILSGLHLDALDFAAYNKRMSHHQDIEHILNAELIAQPELRPLEITARMVLAAAALESARYGQGNDRILRLYRHGTDSTRAEYEKTFNRQSSRFERLIVDLSKRTLIIALEQGHVDTMGHANVYTDKAVIATAGSARSGSINSHPIFHDLLTGVQLSEYRAALQGQLEDFELILSPPSFFTKKEP